MKVTKKQIFWAAILVIVFVQAPHLMSEFMKMSDLPNYWAVSHGALFAIAIDFCVLIFVMRGRTMATILFMVISYIVTIQYYAEYIAFNDNWFRSLSTLMIASAGVLATYYLSEEVKKIDTADDSEYQKNQIKFAVDKAKMDTAKLYEGRLSEFEGDGVVSFSKEDQEIILRRSQNESYQSIIDDFQSRDISISRDRIVKTVKKFKDIYSPVQ